jgi:hypothetical protein
MLDACAPGHERRETDHYIRVKWKSKWYPRLPLGSHASRGKRKRVMVGTSHVRTMVAKLEIKPACADEQLPSLAGSFR